MWRAARDKGGHYYNVEIREPFPWANRRSSKLSPQRQRAEELLWEYGPHLQKTDLVSLRIKICDQVQEETKVSRAQAYNAADRAIKAAMQSIDETVNRMEEH